MKHFPPSGIAVIESLWGKHWDVSVKPFVQAACQMYDDGPLSFHYEMTNSTVAFAEALPRIARMREIKYIYVACHGTEDRIEFFNGDTLSLEEFAALVGGPLAQSGISVQGIHFGVCGFGSIRNLDLLLERTPKISWVSGYARKADWLGSAALDMQLLFHLIGRAEPSARERIISTACELKNHLSGACSDFGLNVLIRDKSTAGSTNLLESPDCCRRSGTS